MAAKGTIKRLFIANRGEIARRIATTARRLGIETVALTDRDVPPAYLLGIVTDFIRVEHESPATYLDGPRIVALACGAGCDSVHPGFGFLSENAEFARQVTAAGMTWVGPNAKAIDAMASKASARDYAERAQVPCVRGLTGFAVPADERGDFSALEAFADDAGYPLLLKAAYGGGGKGMRRVYDKSELRQAALRAYSEAKNSFGDGSLICEQYLTAPRHVEVQILADKHGNAVAVGDRDCSLQRRHQKIIEEAPAPGLEPATRTALHAAAVQLAGAVGYDSTGTVEFLLDWSDTARKSGKQKFFFLEMNTRLQVEHPVTEEVFGLDLVEWQLRVACGEALPKDFSQMTPRGHSVEARLYAEDVANGFFPSPGPVAAFKPALGPGVRWELGLDDTDVITGRFDPMIAKLVTTGATREAALSRMAEALSRTFFAGPASNLGLLLELVTTSRFAKEPVTTHYLADELPALTTAMEQRAAPLKAWLAGLIDQAASGTLGVAATAHQVGVEALTEYSFSNKISSISSGAGARLAAGAALTSAADPRQAAVCGQGTAPFGDAERRRAFWYASLKLGSDRYYWAASDGCVMRRDVVDVSIDAAKHAGAGSDDITAPVPGKVIGVTAKAGSSVDANVPVFVLESMKMEFEIKTSRTGHIAKVLVKVGDQVTAGQTLALYETSATGGKG
jgi:acetyl/propionyl-CoA carboxylase alpha subunit